MKIFLTLTVDGDEQLNWTKVIFEFWNAVTDELKHYPVFCDAGDAFRKKLALDIAEPLIEVVSELSSSLVKYEFDEKGPHEKTIEMFTVDVVTGDVLMKMGEAMKARRDFEVCDPDTNLMVNASLSTELQAEFIKLAAMGITDHTKKIWDRVVEQVMEITLRFGK